MYLVLPLMRLQAEYILLPPPMDRLVTILASTSVSLTTVNIVSHRDSVDVPLSLLELALTLYGFSGVFL